MLTPIGLLPCRKPVAPSREGDTAAQAKYDYAYAPRVFEEGTPAKRGYTWRAASRAFFPSLRVQASPARYQPLTGAVASQGTHVCLNGSSMQQGV